MFVTVRYGDDRKELFNPNCRNKSLLNNIRERCDCDEEEIIDLSDEEGCLKNLKQHPMDYANKYLNHREILILVKGEKADDESISYVPMLDGLENNAMFLERLNPPPPKNDESSRYDSSTNRLHPALARGKRASLVPRQKNSLNVPTSGGGNGKTRSLSPAGRRGSRARSQSVQLNYSPSSQYLNLIRKAR